MSSLYVRPNSKHVWIKYRARDGRLIQRPTPFTKQGLRFKQDGAPAWPNHILRWKAALDQQLALGTWGTLPNRATMPISQAMEQFISAVTSEAGKQQKSAKTVVAYRTALKSFVGLLGDLPIGKINEDSIRDFRDKVLSHFTDQTASSYLRSLSPMFRWLVHRGHIVASPISRYVMVTPATKKIVVFTDDDLKAIFKAVDADHPDVARFYRFLLLTGLRPGETANLRWSDIDADHSIIQVWNSKENRHDPFPIDAKLKHFLAGIPMAGDRVLGFASPSFPSHVMTHLVDDLKLNPAYTLYTLRKTYITGLVRANVPPAIAHKLARHTSFSTTLKYYVAFDVSDLRDSLRRSRKKNFLTKPRGHKSRQEGQTEATQKLQ